jgi:hypothetical protein
MTDLTQQQLALLERYHRAQADWAMAINYKDAVWASTAYIAALDACLAAGVDPFHHPAPQ